MASRKKDGLQINTGSFWMGSLFWWWWWWWLQEFIHMQKLIKWCTDKRTAIIWLLLFNYAMYGEKENQVIDIKWVDEYTILDLSGEVWIEHTHWMSEVIAWMRLLRGRIEKEGVLCCGHCHIKRLGNEGNCEADKSSQWDRKKTRTRETTEQMKKVFQGGTND